MGSAIKSVRIGNVPDRGGIPDSYGPRTAGSRAGGIAGASSSAPPRPAPKSGSPRPTNSIRVTESGSGSSSGAAMPPEAGAAVASQASLSANAEPSRVVANPNEKKDIQVGARSSNKELMHHARVKQKEEAKQPNTYWEQLHEARGGF